VEVVEPGEAGERRDLLDGDGEADQREGAEESERDPLMRFEGSYRTTPLFLIPDPNYQRSNQWDKINSKRSSCS
jgi:hypothetical protein